MRNGPVVPVVVLVVLHLGEQHGVVGPGEVVGAATYGQVADVHGRGEPDALGHVRRARASPTRRRRRRDSGRVSSTSPSRRRRGGARRPGRRPSTLQRRHVVGVDVDADQRARPAAAGCAHQLAGCRRRCGRPPLDARRTAGVRTGSLRRSGGVQTRCTWPPGRGDHHLVAALARAGQVRQVGPDRAEARVVLGEVAGQGDDGAGLASGAGLAQRQASRAWRRRRATGAARRGRRRTPLRVGRPGRPGGGRAPRRCAAPLASRSRWPVPRRRERSPLVAQPAGDLHLASLEPRDALAAAGLLVEVLVLEQVQHRDADLATGPGGPVEVEELRDHVRTGSG